MKFKRRHHRSLTYHQIHGNRLHKIEQSGVASSERKQVITKQRESAKRNERAIQEDFKDVYIIYIIIITGERGGSVVECRTPEREVGGSKPTAAVLCP